MARISTNNIARGMVRGSRKIRFRLPKIRFHPITKLPTNATGKSNNGSHHRRPLSSLSSNRGGTSEMADNKGAKAAWGDPLACLHLSYLELPARRLGCPPGKTTARSPNSRHRRPSLASRARWWGARCQIHDGHAATRMHLDLPR
jgi:hypothetical protein